jgi:hypothetical protein
MKSKMNQQVQPPEALFLCNQRAEEELVTFHLAVASYLDHASNEAGLSFHQYLCGFLAAKRDGRDHSSRR